MVCVTPNVNSESFQSSLSTPYHVLCLCNAPRSHPTVGLVLIWSSAWQESHPDTVWLNLKVGTCFRSTSRVSATPQMQARSALDGEPGLEQGHQTGPRTWLGTSRPPTRPDRSSRSGPAPVAQPHHGVMLAVEFTLAMRAPRMVRPRPGAKTSRTPASTVRTPVSVTTRSASTRYGLPSTPRVRRSSTTRRCSTLEATAPRISSSGDSNIHNNNNNNAVHDDGRCIFGPGRNRRRPAARPRTHRLAQNGARAQTHAKKSAQQKHPKRTRQVCVGAPGERCAARTCATATTTDGPRTERPLRLWRRRRAAALGGRRRGSGRPVEQWRQRPPHRCDQVGAFNLPQTVGHVTHRNAPALLKQETGGARRHLAADGPIAWPGRAWRSGQ